MAASPAAALSHDPRPRQIKAAKRAFKGQGTARSRANKAQFRTYNHPHTINLHPYDPRYFTKVKGSKPYKYPQPR